MNDAVLRTAIPNRILYPYKVIKLQEKSYRKIKKRLNL